MTTGTVDAWCAPVSAAHLASAYMLTPRERRRLDRFPPIDRNRTLLGRCMLRLALQSRLGIPWQEIDVHRDCPTCGNPHGRPTVSDRHGTWVSVSHAGDWVAVAVTNAGPVGIDLERRSRLRRQTLAHRILSPDERRRPGANDQLADYWTRKEAFLKALGAGLTIIPTTVTVPAPPTEGPGQVRRADTTIAASFWSLRPDTNHAGAICVLDAHAHVHLRDGVALLSHTQDRTRPTPTAGPIPMHPGVARTQPTDIPAGAAHHDSGTP